METFSALLIFCEGNPPVTVGFLHKGQWRGSLIFSLPCTGTNGWANNGGAGDLGRHCTYYDATLIQYHWIWKFCKLAKLFRHDLRHNKIERKLSKTDVLSLRWKPKVFLITNLSSRVSPEVGILTTTCGATSDEKCTMTSLGYHCVHIYMHIF